MGWDKASAQEWVAEFPKNLSMCINFSQPVFLSEPFPILSRWNKCRRGKCRHRDSSLRVSSFTFCWLIPLLWTYLLDSKWRYMAWPWKSEVKTIPENLGHMFFRAGATKDCVHSRGLINVFTENHNSILKGILNFLQKFYPQLGLFLNHKFFQAPRLCQFVMCLYPVQLLWYHTFLFKIKTKFKTKTWDHSNSGNFKIWLKM